LLGLLWFGSGTTQATTFLTLQSTYLGAGWFQYQMNVLNDPFFAEADITGFGISFTNALAEGPLPTGWVDEEGGAGAEWTATTNYPPRPYTLTYLVQSSETSYRLDTGTNLEGAMILFSLVLAETYPGAASGVISGNIVGYGWMPCLVPCSPAEADGSPTNYVFTLKLLPDIVINQLIQTNGTVYGVDFSWDSAATFVLQGTSDLINWTNITYLWSYPPETVWTTNAPLNSYGQFFRVELVADGHQTNLPPLSANLALTPATPATANLSATTPHVTGCQFARGKVLVSVATQSGQTAQVQAMDAHQVVRQTQSVTAAGPAATVSFDAGSLPSPVFFRAAAVNRPFKK